MTSDCAIAPALNFSNIAVDHDGAMSHRRRDSVSVSFTSPMSITGTQIKARIQLCGRLKVDIDGEHVTPLLRGRRGPVLLAYLVLKNGEPATGDELIEAIWPDSLPVDPGAALRTQL